MALGTVGYDVCLAIYFELWQYCTTVFAAVVPRRCVVFRSKLSAVRCAAWVSRPPTVGAATAIGWWRCSGCLDYVMMDSVARKGGKRRENCCNGGSFCFARTRKKWRCCFLPLLNLSIFAPNLEVFFFFTQPFYYAFFQVLAFSSLCMLALFGAVSCDDVSAEPKAFPPFVKIPAAGGEQPQRCFVRMVENFAQNGHIKALKCRKVSFTEEIQRCVLTL